VAGNAAAGAGVGPGMLHYIMGITKAYTTRVGSGPFPAELPTDAGVGEHLSRVGHEFGTVTGRARRCGWFDAALLRRSVQINGVSGMCLTKLDVLDGIESLKLCTGYKIDGRDVDIFPVGAEEAALCVPVYEEMPGWTETTVGAKSMEELPANARAYIKRIEELVGVPIDMVSTGPDREETIVLRHPFNATRSSCSNKITGMTEMNTPASTEKDLWVSWDEYNRLVERLALQVYESNWKFDMVLCLARGGVRPGDVISRIFDVPLAILSTSSYREEAGTKQGNLDIAKYMTMTKGPLAGRILLVDDLADSGVTLQRVREHLTENYADVTEVVGCDLGERHLGVHAGLPPGRPAAQPVDPSAVRGLRRPASAPAVGVDEEIREVIASSAPRR
jgi:hypoxanthine-guanine phosphoribosyltransferase